MENIKDTLKNILVELLGEDVDTSEDLGFFDMGISSLTLVTFCERVEDTFKIICDESTVFNYPNIEEMAEYIVQQRG